MKAVKGLNELCEIRELLSVIPLHSNVFYTISFVTLIIKTTKKKNFYSSECIEMQLITMQSLCLLNVL